MIVLCAACAEHYGDTGPCDEGKPVNSPHRRGIPIPFRSDVLCADGVVCSVCGCWPHHPDCSARPKEDVDGEALRREIAEGGPCRPCCAFDATGHCQRCGWHPGARYLGVPRGL